MVPTIRLCAAIVAITSFTKRGPKPLWSLRPANLTKLEVITAPEQTNIKKTIIKKKALKLPTKGYLMSFDSLFFILPHYFDETK